MEQSMTIAMIVNKDTLSLKALVRDFPMLGFLFPNLSLIQKPSLLIGLQLFKHLLIRLVTLISLIHQSLIYHLIFNFLWVSQILKNNLNLQNHTIKCLLTFILSKLIIGHWQINFISMLMIFSFSLKNILSLVIKYVLRTFRMILSHIKKFKFKMIIKLSLYTLRWWEEKEHQLMLIENLVYQISKSTLLDVNNVRIMISNIK